MYMRSLFALALVAVPAFSIASFDMMLIGTNSSSNYRVSRYDPVNRISLGSFGQGIIASVVDDVAVDQTTSTAYVLSGQSNVYRFNYNTGEFLGVVGGLSGGNTMNFDPVSRRFTIASATGSGGSVYNEDFSLYLGGITPAGAFIGGAPVYNAATNKWYSMAYTNANPFNLVSQTWNSDFTGGINSAASSLTYNAGYELGEKSIVLGNKLYTLTYQRTAGTYLYSSTIDNSGNAGAPTLFGNTNGSSGGYLNHSIVAGHNGLAWTLCGNVLRGFHPVTGFGTPVTLSGLGTANELRGAAIVLAPEPGTMIALGVGLATLARRRRTA